MGGGGGGGGGGAVAGSVIMCGEDNCAKSTCVNAGSGDAIRTLARAGAHVGVKVCDANHSRNRRHGRMDAGARQHHDRAGGSITRDFALVNVVSAAHGPRVLHNPVRYFRAVAETLEDPWSGLCDGGRATCFRCRTSHVTRHTSHVTRHTSHVDYFAWPQFSSLQIINDNMTS